MAEKRIPKRSEISDEFKWHINDIYPSDEAFEKALEDAGRYPEILAGYAGNYNYPTASLPDRSVFVHRGTPHWTPAGTKDRGNSLFPEKRYICKYAKNPGTDTSYSNNGMRRPEYRHC